MKFKKNFHVAKKFTSQKVNKMIENYPKPYEPAKYLIFIKTMIDKGWQARVYTANKVSKYVFVSKGEQIFKVRFSNHKPIAQREEDHDCDFYAGISNYQVSTFDKIIKQILSL